MFRIHYFFAVLLFLSIVSCSTEGYDGSQNRLVFDFEDESEFDLLGWECGTVMERDKRHSTSGQYSLRVEMYPNSEYPGFKCFLEEKCRGGKRMLVDIYNPGQHEIRLSYRIDDQDNPPYENRANGRFIALPGWNIFAVDLEGLLTSDGNRQMDVAAINSLAIFVHRPEKPVELFIDNVRLERQ
ncbi:MAG: hypothetical protein V1706_15520 [Pseudomonadota bacterium]